MELPDQRAILTSFVMPLAFLPAASWSVGLMLSSEAGRGGIGLILHRGVVTYFGTVLSVFLLAASLYLLAPLFNLARDWARAFQVAAFSSAPVLLAGLLLAIPNLAFSTLIGVFHSFYLQYSGVHYVLGAKEGDAAEYVALVAVALVVASTFMGAAGSAAGIL